MVFKGNVNSEGLLFISETTSDWNISAETVVVCGVVNGVLQAKVEMLLRKGLWQC